MQNRTVRVGPVAMLAAATNILNGGAAPTAVGFTAPAPVLTLTHLRLVNKTGAAATASLFIGATGASAAGTEFAFSAVSIPANSYVEWFGKLRLDSTDFLTGLASAITTITFEAEGEYGFQ